MPDAADSGRLRRNPKRGRLYYRPARRRIPRGISPQELARRLYAPGGPKHGLRARRDVVEKRAILNAYLQRRARGERSGAWATTTGELIRGLMPAMAALEAKPWDPDHRGGGDDELRRHYATVVASLLTDLEQIGVLRWGGEKDNNNLWWRLRIELKDPWPWTPPKPPCDSAVTPPPAKAPRRTAPTAARLAARQAGAVAPPAAASISNNSEEPFRSTGYAGTTTPLKHHSTHTTNLYLRTGARLNNQTHDASDNRHAALSSARKRNSNSSNEGGGVLGEQAFGNGVVARVAERLCDPAWRRQQRVLATQRRRRLAQVRCWAAGKAVPAWMICEAAATARAVERLPPLNSRQRERLTRSVARYRRYHPQRPASWPEHPLAALIELAAAAGPQIRAPLPWAISQLDIESKRMRRAHKHAHQPRYNHAARKRAQIRQAHTPPGRPFWRTPRPSVTIEQLERARRALSGGGGARDGQLAALELLGRIATPEQLRRELRDRYLLEHGHPGGYAGHQLGASSGNSLARLSAGTAACPMAGNPTWRAIYPTAASKPSLAAAG